MPNKSDKEIVEHVVKALRDIVALSHVTCSMGRFIKTEALITAAEFLRDSLEDRCPEELKEKIEEVKERRDPAKDSQDWII